MNVLSSTRTSQTDVIEYLRDGFSELKNRIQRQPHQPYQQILQVLPIDESTRVKLATFIAQDADSISADNMYFLGFMIQHIKGDPSLTIDIVEDVLRRIDEPEIRKTDVIEDLRECFISKRNAIFAHQVTNLKDKIEEKMLRFEGYAGRLNERGRKNLDKLALMIATSEREVEEYKQLLL